MSAAHAVKCLRDTIPSRFFRLSIPQLLFQVVIWSSGDCWNFDALTKIELFMHSSGATSEDGVVEDEFLDSLH